LRQQAAALADKHPHFSLGELYTIHDPKFLAAGMTGFGFHRLWFLFKSLIDPDGSVNGATFFNQGMSLTM
jgi:hypothetical protein